MTVNLISESKPEFPFHYRDLAKKVIARSLETEGFPYPCEITLSLVRNPEIQALNRETRQIDAPTDVLSFPMLEYPGAGDFSDLDEQLPFITNPDTEEVMLGDIVLSIDRVYSQAEEYGHSVRREYAFLITHSMLHLLGYDHMDEEEAKVMEDHQRRILHSLNINR